MNANLEVTLSQADLIERALLAYGRDKSPMIREDVVALVREVKAAKVAQR